MNVGIILAGGSGTRLRSKIPKQFMSLNGKMVIQYVIDAFEQSNCFDKIIIVGDFFSIKHTVIKAGKTRNESIKNGLDACPKNTTKVLFHDSARPFIKAEDIKQYIDELDKHTAVITSEKITDALFHAPREKYRLIQTPEAFRYKYLIKYFDIERDCVAIYEQCYPCKIKFIELNHPNYKLTYSRDLYLAEQLMKYQDVVKRIPNVKNKSILIFGGTGGIGKALTLYLKTLKANVRSLGSKQFDLSNSANCFFDDEKYDSIIYCAGAYCNDSEGIIDNYDKIMNVNFRSFVNIIEHAEQFVRKNGSIIAIGSTASSKGRKGIALYSASKSALNTFVEGMTEPLREKNIKIHVICPAKVNTQLQEYINPKANKTEMIQPKDLAKIIAGYIDIESTGNIVYVKVGQE